jgi:hypothetical protein
MKAALQSRLETAKSFVERHQALVPFLTFVGGFVFDVFTLGRIDQAPVIIQQAVYIFICAALLANLFLRPEWVIENSRFWNLAVSYRMAILHFVFGSLLSCYTLFYFKSTSISVSFIFVILIATILIANEFPYFQNLGLGIKSALLALCTVSFLSYLVPIFFGVIGAGVFILSILISMVVLYSFVHYLKGKNLNKQTIERQILAPMAIVILIFSLAYFFKVLPPVPLSLQYVGVYHSVEKTEDNMYKLGHYAPWWKFWSYGDQTFVAQPGDKIIIFFRLFAPANFQEEIRLIWSKKNALGDWELQDQIPIAIHGGRDSGFRGYGVKSNFSDGDWRTQVVTSDDREIGRISFSVQSSESQTEPLQFDYH